MDKVRQDAIRRVLQERPREWKPIGPDHAGYPKLAIDRLVKAGWLEARVTLSSVDGNGHASAWRVSGPFGEELFRQAAMVAAGKVRCSELQAYRLTDEGIREIDRLDRGDTCWSETVALLNAWVAPFGRAVLESESVSSEHPPALISESELGEAHQKAAAFIRESPGAAQKHVAKAAGIQTDSFRNNVWPDLKALGFKSGKGNRGCFPP